jgi:alpha-1,6-mannosyltransferase
LRHLAVFARINRADYARTIYQPAAQMIFGLLGRISRTVTGMKIAMAVFELVAVLCLLRLLSIARLPRERILIYAWNPLVLWSFAGDGHVDAAAVGLLAIALLCHAGRRVRLAAAFVAGAVLVKFLPAVVAPTFVRRGRLWWPALTGAAVVALLYVPYLSAGPHVLGFLPTYGVEEGIDDGSGFWLLAGLSHLVTLPRGAAAVYILCVAAGLGVLALRIVQGRAGDGTNEVVVLCRDTAILAACATVAISPHYAWYFAWLALPSVVAPLPPVIWLSAARVALFLDPFHERFFWPSLVYLPAAGLALAAFQRRRYVPHAAIAASQGNP